MGGRGAKSSGGGAGVVPENLARELFETKTTKRLKEFISWFKDDRNYYLENDEIRDEDLTWWIIDKNGDEHTLNWDDSIDDYKQVKLNKIAYIMLQSGDGIDDSMGFSSDMLGNDDDSEKLNAYTDEVNRLYGTLWGKRH